MSWRPAGLRGALCPLRSPLSLGRTWEACARPLPTPCPPCPSCGGSRTRLARKARRLGLFVSSAPGAFSGRLGPFGLRPCGHRARPRPEVRTVSRCISDYAKGFGGKYGVQKDRMDKVSAAHLPPVGPGRAEPSVSVRCPAGGLGWRGPLSRARPPPCGGEAARPCARRPPVCHGPPAPHPCGRATRPTPSWSHLGAASVALRATCPPSLSVIPPGARRTAGRPGARCCPFCGFGRRRSGRRAT